MYFKSTIFLLILLKCINSQNFEMKFRIYDFEITQPGFGFNYTYYSTLSPPLLNSGMLKPLLHPTSFKPQYCCGTSPFNYIQDESQFTNSFVVTPSQSVSVVKSVTIYPIQDNIGSGYITRYARDSFPNQFFPINGEGLNVGISGNNFAWCLEGHYEFQYFNNIPSPIIQMGVAGEYSVFIDGKLAIESSGTANSANYVNVANLNLVHTRYYPMSVFACQRFSTNRPILYFNFKSSFPFRCLNIPGINDDVCPYVRPTCTTSTCNDGKACTTDECPAPTTYIPPGGNVNIKDYCIHTPVSCPESNLCNTYQCNNSTGCVATPIVTCTNANKCLRSIGCNPATGQCETEPIVCNDNIACTTDTCNPSTGCVYTPDSSKCSDSDECTNSVCTLTGCSTTPVVCEDDIGCTTNSCNSTTGCSFTPVNSNCDDNNLCTVNQCTSTGCTFPPVDCNNDPNNKCIVKTCNASTGVCDSVTKQCETIKLLTILPLLCQKQKCDPPTGGCVNDGVQILCLLG